MAPESQKSEGIHGRLLTVIVAIVIGVSFVGFAVGTHPAEEPAPQPSAPEPVPQGVAVPGQTYEELRDRRFGPISQVTADLPILRKGIPEWFAQVNQTEEQRRAALAARAALRAYEGAPPVIPHLIDEQTSGACLACHEQGVVVAGRIAPVLSHPPYQSCTQCHVPALPRPHDTGQRPQSSFVGLRSPGRGTRAWLGAPPTIPHLTWMRQNCSSCHGVAGRPGLRTPHPGRLNCEQCHVEAATAGPSGVPR
jgi:cytochrome c-type protein NapB